MNRDRARELLPIIQAFADGKDVQPKLTESMGWCPPCVDPDFNDDAVEWRIKPEPREFYIPASTANNYVADQKVGLQQHQHDGWIKVREVLDE